VQSLHMPFGSGLVLPQTGIVWHDRACAFSLDPDDRNLLEPRRKPFHTLSPALARLKDGRTMVWGASGGDGQPQIQAQVFTRSVVFGQDLQTAVSAPRWVVRRTLDMEGRFSPDVVERLRAAGHTVEVMGPLEASLGQAGALARRHDGMIDGAAHPRGDGSVAGW
jgi:gamma-glutamyltranspeptidase